MSESQDQATCPVDHKSREAWLSQARAASQSQTEPQPQSFPPSHPPASSDMQDSCPVDHKARDVWTQQARAAAPESPVPRAPSQVHPVSSTSSSSWTSSLFSYLHFTSQSSTTTRPTPSLPIPPTSALGTRREISTIPRASQPNSDSARPANQEQETGVDKASGNWIYPSEKMFFEAMKRKGHDPHSSDMQTVVPIHNAVNERAWAEIKEWEEPWIQGSSCDGPRLHSFSGLSTKMSPKARVNSLLGYQTPFDRHDWVVDRCGKEIEYIIDFYAGRQTGGSNGKLSFYLDVRPKLNSWEGVKMRFMKGLGAV
ncbi:cytochrome c/c1 heme lyase [Xylariales sp. AK1849]|nr:cytochrome c/c1 heme lyase [Xylariales sp. AK1849]